MRLNRVRNSKRLFVLGAAAAACLAYYIVCGGPYRPIEPLPSRIIDMHCHVAGIGAGDSGCFVSPRLRHSWRFRVYLKSFGVSEKDLLEHGDELVPDRVSQLLAQSRFVNQAVILALDGVVDRDGRLDTNRTDVYVSNEFVAKAVASHTNLLFGASINPHRKDALERLVWAKEHGAVLVKWIPSIMDIDPSDPSLIPFYKKMVELDLPLLTHEERNALFPARMMSCATRKNCGFR